MKRYRKNREVTHLFKMHPYDFLRLTTDDDEHIQEIRKKARSLQVYNDYDQITEYLIENDLYLDIRLNKEGTVGKIFNHEGRHRSAAVLNAGEDEIEVSIKFLDHKLRDITPTKMPKKLIHQMAKTWRGLKTRTVPLSDIKVARYKTRRNPISKLEELRSEFRDAAQAEYDSWHQDETGYSSSHDHYGGICGEIAEAICNILEDNNISSTTFSPSIGDVHVWAVADIDGEAYRVDIIPQVYETGGGYTWRKIPDVTFDERDIIIQSMWNSFEDYLNE